MTTMRSLWQRVLRLDSATAAAISLDLAPSAHTRACSRFRSLDDPARFATYVVQERSESPFASDPDADDHTLSVVREFRRVPLHATGLGLVVFTARPGRTAALVAALAHFAERAVSTYQPAYLLLARSMQSVITVVLITGVHERAALVAMQPSAFSLDVLMPEIAPLLRDEPEWYAYCPADEEDDLLEISAVSRRVV
jgi:hypothetical protein